MAQVILEQLTKSFGGRPVVDAVGLHVRDRELLVLVGPSGCGKTTTLRMIAGLDEVTSGSIRLGARVIDHLPPRERNVALVLQHGALYPHLNVYQNLAFGLQLRHVPRPEIETRVRAAADVLGIGELLTRAPWQLSGGERQRVALGRALVRQPDVFLLDEPLSSLDAKLRAAMRAELVQLQRRLATTMIHVTHDQVEALTMGDRIAVMQAGRLQQVGTPREVYQAPANRFVAEFIGAPTMRFLAGTLRCEADETFLDCSTFRVGFPPEPTGRYAAWYGRRVLFGIRAEAIHVGGPPAGNRDHWQTLRATVSLVQTLGADTILELERDGHQFTARGERDSGPALRTGPTRPLVAGDVVDICVDTTQGHLFDPNSGVRL